jgi:Fe-S cluster assembly ATP-binding protein
MLQIKNLTASVEGKTILKNISCTFEAGKTYALLGPNGSGKSTLASVIMGHPSFTTAEDSSLLFEGKELKEMSADARAKEGIFLSFQSPLPLPGVGIYSLLRFALDKKVDALTLRNKVKEIARELHIQEELLSRSLNDGFSGGEKKKMEVLQWAILQPKVAIFDEVDTGVDVDALKTIAEFLKKHRQSDQTLIFITHSTSLLKTLEPDETIVLKDGEIMRQGDGTLAIEIIEKEGFGKMTKISENF